MSVTEIPRPSERNEWLAERHKWANASDAAVYMGCHPFKTLADLTVEKLAENPPDVTNRAMERGNRLEAAIADWWADENGVAVYEPSVMYAAGRILATLDRRIHGNDREALEIKTTAKKVDEPEGYWFWQVQAQMVCADLDRVHIAALDGTMDLKTFVVERDDVAIGRLIQAVETVWGYFDLGMVPECVELGAEHVAALHPEPEPGSVVDADEQLDVVADWLVAKDKADAATKAEKEARDRLCALIGEAETVRINGVPVATWKAQTRTSLDTKALLADHPDLKSKYERTSSFRVLRRAS